MAGRRLWILAGIAAAVAALIGALRSEGESQVYAGVAAPTAAAVGAAGSLPASAIQQHPPRLTQNLATETAPGPQAPVHRAEFLRLAGNPSARDAYAAYAMLSQCRQARENDRIWRDTPQHQRTESITGARESLGADYAKKACGDLTEIDLGPSSRLALLEKAAAAGLPQAAIWMSAEGPFGDPTALATSPDDPAVHEWQRKVARLIELAADGGDVVSAMSLAEQYATGGGVMGQPDQRKALMYAVAYRKLHELQQGRQTTLAQVNELTQGMKPEEADQARLEGEKFATEAYARWLARKENRQ